MNLKESILSGRKKKRKGSPKNVHDIWFYLCTIFKNDKILVVPKGWEKGTGKVDTVTEKQQEGSFWWWKYFVTWLWWLNKSTSKTRDISVRTMESINVNILVIMLYSFARQYPRRKLGKRVHGRSLYYFLQLNKNSQWSQNKKLKNKNTLTKKTFFCSQFYKSDVQDLTRFSTQSTTNQNQGNQPSVLLSGD